MPSISKSATIVSQPQPIQIYDEYNEKGVMGTWTSDGDTFEFPVNYNFVNVFDAFYTPVLGVEVPEGTFSIADTMQVTRVDVTISYSYSRQVMYSDSQRKDASISNTDEARIYLASLYSTDIHGNVTRIGSKSSAADGVLTSSSAGRVVVTFDEDTIPAGTINSAFGIRFQILSDYIKNRGFTVNIEVQSADIEVTYQPIPSE